MCWRASFMLMWSRAILALFDQSIATQKRAWRIECPCSVPCSGALSERACREGQETIPGARWKKRSQQMSALLVGGRNTNASLTALFFLCSTNRVENRDGPVSLFLATCPRQNEAWEAHQCVMHITRVAV